MIRVRARDVRPSRVGVWRHGDAARVDRSTRVCVGPT